MNIVFPDAVQIHVHGGKTKIGAMAVTGGGVGWAAEPMSGRVRVSSWLPGLAVFAVRGRAKDVGR